MGYRILWIRAVLFVFIAVIVCGNVAIAEQRFPLPVFESGYELPELEPPQHCNRTVVSWAMLVGYVIALAVAAVAAYHWRSRRVLFGLAVGSVLLFGLYFEGCVCPVGSVQNVLAAVFWPKTTVAITVLLLFCAPIIAALFFGRVFCAAVCPLGAVQELTALFPQRIPPWLESVLGLFRYIYLAVVALFVWCGLPFLLCKFDPYVGFFRQSGPVTVLIFGALLLFVGLFYCRPYCRFLCPYGAILGVCSRLAPRQVHITPGNCTNCRLCEKMCPYGAILEPTRLPTAEEKVRGPIRMLLAILVAPLVILCMTGLARQLAFPLAALHPDVAIVPLLQAEATGEVPERGMFDETEAFYKRQISTETQYDVAATVYCRVLTGCTVFGVVVGMLISLKGIHVTLRRRRTEYQVDPAKCVACGRCFWYCPNQQENRVFLDAEHFRL